MKTPLWSLLTALLRLLCVQGASDDGTPVPECSDERVRLDSSLMGPGNTVYSTILSGDIGDVQGIIHVCEEQQWKNVVVCNEEMWTMMNTVVACRDLGYATAASFGVHDNQVVGQSNRLSYIPDCTGDEERLVDCEHGDHDDECGSPVVISCWNSSVDTSQPTSVIPSATLTTHSVLPTLSAPAVFSSMTISSMSSQQPPSSLPVITQPPSNTPLAPLATDMAPSSDVASSGMCWQSVVYSGVAGVGVGAVVVGALALAILWRTRKPNTSRSDNRESQAISTGVNPAYQTTTSLIPSSTNPAYAGLPHNSTQSRQLTVQLYEDIV